jgi:hypothetical protein
MNPSDGINLEATFAKISTSRIQSSGIGLILKASKKLSNPIPLVGNV